MARWAPPHWTAPGWGSSESSYPEFHFSGPFTRRIGYNEAVLPRAHSIRYSMTHLLSNFRCRSTVAIAIVLGMFSTGCVEAGVVVIANRTAKEVAFSVVQPDESVIPHRLPPGDVFPVPVADKVGVAFDTEAGPRRLLLETNSVYYFVDQDENLDLIKAAFPEVATRRVPSSAPERPIRLESVGTIPVMVLVDDNEPAVRRIWEERLRQRFADVSDIFERHCRIRFEVVAVGTWDSDNRILDFEKSLSEFELEVTPTPAKLAVGFTSQYQIPRGRTHLGGTRGALHSHILIREWSQHITKTERLEVLLHELGHYLGASHSLEAISVMRPTLGDRLSHARSFRIGFDPPNTLIMNCVCEALRTRNVSSLWQLHPDAKTRLHGIYNALGETLPEDPAAGHYVHFLYSLPSGKRLPSQPKSLVEATQVVVRAIGDAAVEHGGEITYEGDALTEFYVRRAAAAAAALPKDWAAKAFLLGLGIGLDDSWVLRSSPLSRGFCARVESLPERTRRLTTLDGPTMHGRKDLMQHFVVSCALASLIGRSGAETAGILKEMRDSQTGSGFSFVDLSADLAGTTFAEHVADAKLPLATLADSFRIEAYLPEDGDLEEGISWKDFLDQYASAHDDRFLRGQTAIRRRVLTLPGYRLGRESE